MRNWGGKVSRRQKELAWFLLYMQASGSEVRGENQKQLLCFNLKRGETAKLGNWTRPSFPCRLAEFPKGQKQNNIRKAKTCLPVFFAELLLPIRSNMTLSSIPKQWFLYPANRNARVVRNSYLFWVIGSGRLLKSQGRFLFPRKEPNSQGDRDLTTLISLSIHCVQSNYGTNEPGSQMNWGNDQVSGTKIDFDAWAPFLLCSFCPHHGMDGLMGED